jgi:hypothetical protein
MNQYKLGKFVISLKTRCERRSVVDELLRRVVELNRKYYSEFGVIEYLCISDDFHELSQNMKIPHYVYDFENGEQALFCGEMHAGENATDFSHRIKGKFGKAKLPPTVLKLSKTERLELVLHNAKIELWENKLKKAKGEIAIAGLKHRISQEKLKREKLEAKGNRAT